MWSNDYIDDDELMHYGRKGMKWGQYIYIYICQRW